MKYEHFFVEKKDETPFSTMKFGSDTLDEDQEKKLFFRVNDLLLIISIVSQDHFQSRRISNKIKTKVN